MTKRSGGSDNQDNNGNGSKKKKYAFMSSLSIQPGMQGIYINCPMGRELQAAKEMKQLLDNFYEHHFSATLESDKTSPEKKKKEASIEDAFLDEMQQLSATSDEKLFYSISIGIDCCAFIKVHKSIPIMSFFYAFVGNIYAERKKQSRYIQRITPIQNFCMANVQDILNMAKPLIHEHFPPQEETESPTKSFAIIPRIRNCEKLNRDILIPEIAKLFNGPNYKVDLKNPDFAVIVEVSKTICGVSVVKDFFKCKKYGLEMIYQEFDPIH